MNIKPRFPAPTPRAAGSSTLSGSAPKSIDSRDLLGDARAVHIDHGDQRYTLRLTRENKLILTK